MLAGFFGAIGAAQAAHEMAVSSLPPRAVLVAAAAALCAVAFALVNTFVRLLVSSASCTQRRDKIWTAGQGSCPPARRARAGRQRS